MLFKKLGGFAAQPAFLRSFTKSIPVLSSPTLPRGRIPTPLVTETIGGEVHTYDLFTRLLKERSMNTFPHRSWAKMLLLEAEDRQKPIQLYINTRSVSMLPGLAIYDTMKYIDCPVSTICVGQAACVGSVLLSGGERGKRYCLPNSSVVLEQLDDWLVYASYLYKENLTGKLSIDEIQNLMQKDYYLDAQKALEIGIVDEILYRRVKPVDE